MLAAGSVVPALLILPLNEVEGGPDPLKVGIDVKDWLAAKFGGLGEAETGLSMAAVAAAAAAEGRWVPWGTGGPSEALLCRVYLSLARRAGKPLTLRRLSSCSLCKSKFFFTAASLRGRIAFSLLGAADALVPTDCHPDA